jgi:hypothetical protein
MVFWSIHKSSCKWHLSLSSCAMSLRMCHSPANHVSKQAIPVQGYHPTTQVPSQSSQQHMTINQVPDQAMPVQRQHPLNQAKLPSNKASPIQSNLPKGQAAHVKNNNLPPQTGLTQGQQPPTTTIQDTYDETAVVPDTVDHRIENGHMVTGCTDPETGQEVDARVEGKINKWRTIMSFLPRPLETGRPRRCYAFRDLPLDPGIIPKLKRGTRQQLLDYRGRLVP